MDLTGFLHLGDVGHPALCCGVLLSLCRECGVGWSVGLFVGVYLIYIFFGGERCLHAGGGTV